MRYKSLWISAFLSVLSTPAAQAQTPAAGYRVGQARLFGTSSDQVTITGHLLHRPSRDVAVGVEGGYTVLPRRQISDLFLWQMTGSTRFQRAAGPVRPYILVGAGLYHVHDPAHDDDFAFPWRGLRHPLASARKDQWHTGFNLGLGAALPVSDSGFHFDLEGRFHSVHRGEESKLEWWALAWGLGYR